MQAEEMHKTQSRVISGDVSLMNHVDAWYKKTGVFPCVSWGYSQTHPEPQTHSHVIYCTCLYLAAHTDTFPGVTGRTHTQCFYFHGNATPWTHIYSQLHVCPLTSLFTFYKSVYIQQHVVTGWKQVWGSWSSPRLKNNKQKEKKRRSRRTYI